MHHKINSNLKDNSHVMHLTHAAAVEGCGVAN